MLRKQFWCDQCKARKSFRLDRRYKIWLDDKAHPATQAMVHSLAGRKDLNEEQRKVVDLPCDD
jgi:hypothetical protein